MENRYTEEKLPDSIVKQVEKDLRCYPDWLVRIELGGLGSPSRYGVQVDRDKYSFGSSVEFEAELSEETRKKIAIIEKVYDRFHGDMKDIIEYRYFQGYSREEVLKSRNLKKRKYYNLRDRAIECFARAFGYIE